MSITENGCGICLSDKELLSLPRALLLRVSLKMGYREESALSKMSMDVNIKLVGAGEQVNSANILSDPSKRSNPDVEFTLYQYKYPKSISVGLGIFIY
jgi:hypothetical protein